MPLQNKITVIKFTRKNCGPCRTLEQVLASMESALPGVDFISFDADENPEKVQEYEVHSVPLILIESNGEVLRHLSGIVSREKLLWTIGEVKRETGT